MLAKKEMKQISRQKRDKNPIQLGLSLFLYLGIMKGKLTTGLDGRDFICGRLVSPGPAGANWLEQERKVDFPFLTKAEWAKRKTHNIRIVKIPNNIIRDRTFSPQPLNAWAFCDKLYSNIVDALSLLLTGKEASCLRNHFLYNSGKHMNKAWLCIKSAICRLK